MGVSKNRGGPPKWINFIMENSIEIDDLGGKHHYFRKHPYVLPTKFSQVNLLGLSYSTLNFSAKHIGPSTPVGDARNGPPVARNPANHEGCIKKQSVTNGDKLCTNLNWFSSTKISGCQFSVFWLGMLKSDVGFFNVFAGKKTMKHIFPLHHGSDRWVHGFP